MFRAMLSPRPDPIPPAPAELLNLIAKALVAATADTGDDMTLEDVLNDLVERNRSRRSRETAQDSLPTIE
jgi:hypothetical protein